MEGVGIVYADMMIAWMREHVEDYSDLLTKSM